MAIDDIKPRSNKWRESVPYRKYAFHNIYNYTLLGGVGTAALLTQNWWLAIVGVGLEVLWMVFAPDSPVVRRLWFDKVHDTKLAEIAAKARDEILSALPEYERHRVIALEQKRASILGLCAQNQAFTADLLRGELEKLDQLTASFLDLMALTLRQHQYLQNVDFDDLERQIRRHEQTAETAENESVRGLSQKNLSVLMKRRDKLQEIRQLVATAMAQMELIENTFQLLGDQIVTMRSPKELGGQLDELIDGVEAVRTTARETQSLMEAAG
jgi:hypothetical protein